MHRTIFHSQNTHIMKKSAFLILSLLLTICISACKKNTTDNGNPGLEASKTNSIKKGEPVVFTLPETSAGSTVNWSVSPNANTQLNTSGNTATVLFGAKGTYTVTAESGTSTATTSVSVTDSIYTGGDAPIPPTILPLVTGELINISVSRVDSNSITGLLFIAQTTHNYPCISNYLISETATDASGYTIQYTGVNVPGGCAGNNAKAGGFNFLFPFPTGTRAITIIVAGKTYSGTITKSGDSYTINWPDTTGVIISPTSIQ